MNKVNIRNIYEKNFFKKISTFFFHFVLYCKFTVEIVIIWSKSSGKLYATGTRTAMFHVSESN